MNYRWCPIPGIHYAVQCNKTLTISWHYPGDRVGMQ